MIQRLGISTGHKLQLQAQSAAQKQRIATNGTTVGPRVDDDIADNLMQQLDIEPKPSPAKQEPPRPAPAQRKAPTKQEQKRAKYAKKQQALMRSLATAAWDIRFVAGAQEWLAEWQAVVTHLYVDGRSFIVAHKAGCCGVADCELRREKCATCSSAYMHKGHGHCNSCNCGEWPPSRRTHQTRLANFACPKKKFGRAHGWIPRLLHLIHLRRLSANRR